MLSGTANKNQSDPQRIPSNTHRISKVWESKGDAMLLPFYDNAVLWNRLHVQSIQGIHNTHTHTHTLLKRLFSPPSWKGQRRFSTAQAGHAWQSSLAALCAWSAYSTGPLLPSLLLPQDTLPHKPPRAAAMGHGRCASGHGGVSKVSSYLLGLSNAGAELMEHHIPHPCVPVPTEPVSQLSRPPWGVWRTDGKLFKNLQRSPSRQTVSFLLPL